MAKGPWSKYAVEGSCTGWNNRCMPLISIGHVRHVREALTVVQNRRISECLVYDESKLNKDRTHVVWTSANTSWNKGSIYGNIMFLFPWDTLIRGKKTYWVEDVEKYSPPACRLLVTDEDRNDLEPYDPVLDDGPW